MDKAFNAFTKFNLQTSVKIKELYFGKKGLNLVKKRADFNFLH
jgi:hypothetical protein